MSKIRSVIINEPGYYQYDFLFDKIVIGKIDNHHLHLKCATGETNWLKINEDELPCYLEGSNENDSDLISQKYGKLVEKTFDDFLYIQPPQIQKRKGYESILNQQNAKQLLELEYRETPATESELNNIYKTVFNLSQDEIDQIVKELKFEPFLHPKADARDYITLKKEYEQKKCEHEFISYTGLNETFNYCKKCDQKECL